MASDFARSWAERVRSANLATGNGQSWSQTGSNDIIRGDVAKISQADSTGAAPRLRCCPEQEDARFRALRDASLVSMGALPFSFLHPDPRDPEQLLRDQTRMTLAQADEAGLRVIQYGGVKILFHKDHQWTALRALSCTTGTDPFSRHYDELSRALAVAMMQGVHEEQKLVEQYGLLAGYEVRFCGGRPKGFAQAHRAACELLELMDQVPGWVIRKPKQTDFARLRKPGAGRRRAASAVQQRHHFSFAKSAAVAA